MCRRVRSRISHWGVAVGHPESDGSPQGSGAGGQGLLRRLDRTTAGAGRLRDLGGNGHAAWGTAKLRCLHAQPRGRPCGASLGPRGHLPQPEAGSRVRGQGPRPCAAEAGLGGVHDLPGAFASWSCPRSEPTTPHGRGHRAPGSAGFLPGRSSRHPWPSLLHPLACLQARRAHSCLPTLGLARG